MRVIVTGAASGIGRAVAELLAASDPAHRLLLSDRDAEGLAAVVAEIGPAAAPCVADLADPDCGKALVAAALAHMGGIDAVVSNAGIIGAGALVDLAPGDFDRVFAINTRATWALAKAQVARMLIANTRSKSSGAKSTSAPAPMIPALLTTASIPPM